MQKKKNAWEVVQVVKCLPGKHKALSSNSSTAKRKNTNNNKGLRRHRKKETLYTIGGNVN
jgi:hypothetical protein